MSRRSKEKQTKESNPYVSNELEQFDDEEAPSTSPFWLVLIMSLLFAGWIVVMLLNR